MIVLLIIIIILALIGLATVCIAGYYFGPSIYANIKRQFSKDTTYSKEQEESDLLSIGELFSFFNKI